MTVNSEAVLLFYQDSENNKLKTSSNWARNSMPTALAETVFLRCQRLVRALEAQGYQVLLNDYRVAFSNPHYPVGLLGDVSLMKGWTLQNPAILGPDLLEHPNQVPDLMERPRYARYLTGSDWLFDIFAPAYGSKVGSWHAGIETSEWVDARYAAKSVDVLIVNNLRWDHDELARTLIRPITQHLTSNNLRHRTIRVPDTSTNDYRKQLQQAKSVLFLSEQEKQGLIYQYALASNIPVLAWNPGLWRDPNRLTYTQDSVATSSVPYWSDECGEQFTSVADFAIKFELFWKRLDEYEPRQFVKQQLSMEDSAEKYMHFLRMAAAQHSVVTVG